MRSAFIAFAAFFAVFVLLAGNGAAIDKKLLSGAALQEMNEPAPGFTLRPGSGPPLTLDGLRGRVVVLHIWATWCAPCRKEFPLFERLYTRYRETDLAFIPVAIDTDADENAVDRAARAFGASFKTYLAHKGEITQRYWAWGVPVTYFINRHGVIEARAIGPRDWDSEGVRSAIDAMLKEK